MSFTIDRAKDQRIYMQIYLAGIMKSILITLGDALIAIDV